MPYKIYKTGEKWCVHRENTDGSKGASRGCSDSEDMAKAHMRALYAAENKELLVSETLDQLKSILECDDCDVPESVQAVMAEFVTRKEVNAGLIEDDEEEEDKACAKKPKKKEEEDEDELKAGKREDVSAADRKRAESEYGDVSYADETNKKYPIDTEEHIRAAWNYIHQAKNAAKYSSDEVASIKRKIVSAWKKKIDPAGPPQAAKKEEDDDMRVVDKLKAMADSVTSALKSIFDRNDNANDVMIWKEADGYRWIGRYSNNLRDDDKPKEIIAAESHKKFVDMVDKGLEPLPELWIWHMKSMRIGVSDWVAYDETKNGKGFALAGGHSLPGTEPIFEHIAKVKDIAMSHGMPTESIKYDEQDPTIIVEHKTREISILPRWSAANKQTGFAVLSKAQEEENMIPSDKKERLAKEWGLSEAQISKLEEMNAEDANKAASAGIESKETKDGTAAPVEEVTTTSAQVENVPTTTAPVTEPAAPAPLTDTQVQELFRNAVTEALAPITAKLNELEAQVKELKDADDSKVVKAAAGTPMASLAALLGQTVQSAVGNPLTQVDGRTTLAKSKPAEAEAVPTNGQTFVPFVNKLLAKEQ